MNFDDFKVDKKVLLDYIKKGDLSLNEITGFVNLYKSYLWASNLINDSVDQDKTLMDYENEIYFVDGKKLGEKQKIELELNRIDKVFKILKENMSSSEVDSLTDEILITKKLFLEYSDDEDKVMLNYIKKNISVIQSKLGLKNYFLTAAYDAFNEKYMSIFISKTYKLDKK